ncbi:prostaglandin E receptor 1c (subtype EP1) [Synchiropus splendidus]|uniref:prostaglandin E receptor 1c (subtype EP1) n=1 Tax=Synchiropus splendidus TaxID=270530 RepID=UPI00237D59E4|nr:prostaglandin E receptor 1c (subtype EP1) [Synchiropus splendidus]
MWFNTSDQSWTNTSSRPYARSSSFGLSCFTMIFGALSNFTALGILAKTHIRFRRQAKAPFLFLTVSLLVADLGGHVIPGSFAMYVHMHKSKGELPSEMFCNTFGASMVFFGLCPLLLDCAMALERCVAITQPFFHAAMITVAHVRHVLFFLLTAALVLALLPFFSVGTYTLQSPGTWCFLQVHAPRSVAETNLVLAFSCLGLAALTLSLLCNILSSLALLRARIKMQTDDSVSVGACNRRASSASSSSTAICSLDVEMMVQLAVITIVSCVCWSPFLVHILVMQFMSAGLSSQSDDFILLALRFAAWNQILHPWVYILLRKAVLLKLGCSVPNTPQRAGRPRTTNPPSRFLALDVSDCEVTAIKPTVGSRALKRSL